MAFNWGTLKNLITTMPTSGKGWLGYGSAVLSLVYALSSGGASLFSTSHELEVERLKSAQRIYLKADSTVNERDIERLVSHTESLVERALTGTDNTYKHTWVMNFLSNEYAHNKTIMKDFNDARGVIDYNLDAPEALYVYKDQAVRLNLHYNGEDLEANYESLHKLFNGATTSPYLAECIEFKIDRAVGHVYPEKVDSSKCTQHLDAFKL